MPSEQDIEDSQTQLAAHRATLATFLTQRATFSTAHTPPAVLTGIREARTEIQRLKAVLQAWNIPVEDLSSDTALPPAQAAPPPPSVPARPRHWIPPMVEVPVGPFLMGSTDEQLADVLRQNAKMTWVVNEKTQHRLTLPDYWIGKTPVTNAQFRPFVAGDGYTNQAYWTAAGWHWPTVAGSAPRPASRFTCPVKLSGRKPPGARTKGFTRGGALGRTGAATVRKRTSNAPRRSANTQLGPVRMAHSIWRGMCGSGARRRGASPIPITWRMRGKWPLWKMTSAAFYVAARRGIIVHTCVERTAATTSRVSSSMGYGSPVMLSGSILTPEVLGSGFWVRDCDSFLGGGVGVRGRRGGRGVIVGAWGRGVIVGAGRHRGAWGRSSANTSGWYLRTASGAASPLRVPRGCHPVTSRGGAMRRRCFAPTYGSRYEVAPCVPFQ